MEATSKKEIRLNRFSFALNSFLFLLSGVDFISNGKMAFGLIQVITAIINLSMLIDYKNDKVKLGIQHLLNFLNIIIALGVAVDYLNSGTNYIHYVWFGIAAMYTVVLIIFFKKKADN